MSDTRGFRLDTVEAEWYPQARKKRRGVPQELPQGGFQAPRTRFFPFAINQTANSRRTISCPRCVGPALIKDVTFFQSTLSSPILETLEIGYALTQVTEAGVALTTPRPYTTLVELVDPFDQVASASGTGWPQTTTPTAAGMSRVATPLDLVVTDAEFFPVISVWTNAGLTQLVHGTLRVIEGIDRDAIRFFL